MTIAQALKLAIAKLSAKKINNPPLEAEILLANVLNKPREFLLTRGEKNLTPVQISNFKFLISRRFKGEPIAYLTGRKEFYGLDFLVNKNVLIPRPETELMVDETIKLLAHGSQHITLIDVGTGSGCIIISLAKMLNYESRIMNYGLLATDLSIKALAVAKKNARIHQINKNIKFIKGDLLTPIIHNSLFMIPNSQLIILSNLPYGWPAWKNNCSLDAIGLKFEPPIALFTGQRGLKLYERLFKQIRTLRVARCALRDITALCEFDPRQTVMMKKLIKKSLPRAKRQIKKDLSGLNRLVIITLN